MTRKKLVLIIFVLLSLITFSGCSEGEKQLFSEVCGGGSGGDTTCNPARWWQGGPTRNLNELRQAAWYQENIDYRERLLFLQGKSICNGEDNWHPTEHGLNGGPTLWQWLADNGIPDYWFPGASNPRCSGPALQDYRTKPAVSVANSETPPPAPNPGELDPLDPPDEGCPVNDPNCDECPPNDPNCDECPIDDPDCWEECPPDDAACDEGQVERYSPTQRFGYRYGSQGFNINGNWVTNGKTPVSFSTTNDIKALGCALKRNGQLVLHEPSGCPNSRILQVSNWGDGEYEYTVVVGDGYHGTQGSTQFNVDGTPPSQPLITEGPDSVTFDDDVIFYWDEGNDATSGIAYHECQMDREGWDDCNKGALAFMNLEEGPHTFRIRAVDEAGNISTENEKTSYSFVYRKPLPPRNQTLPLISDEPPADGPCDPSDPNCGDCPVDDPNCGDCPVDDPNCDKCPPNDPNCGECPPDDLECQNPLATSDPLPLAPMEDDPVFSSNGTWISDDRDNELEFSAQWQSCLTQNNKLYCADVAENARGEEITFTPSSDEVGKQLRVRVTAYDQYGNTTVTSQITSAVKPKPRPPVNSEAPVLSGDPKQGATLTTTNGTWTGDSLITYTYQWQRCRSNTEPYQCNGIGDPSSETTRKLLAIDGDKYIRVIVIAANPAGSNIRAASNFIGPIKTAPKNTTPPTISGVAQNGQTLNADPGVWEGTAPITYAYQWQQCTSNTDLTSCSNIAANSKAQSYTPGTPQVGKYLRVVVTASNEVDNSVKERSALTSAVLAKGAATGQAETGQALVIPSVDDGNLAIYIPAKQDIARNGLRAKISCKEACPFKLTAKLGAIGLVKAGKVAAGGSHIIVIRATKAQNKKIAKLRKGSSAQVVLTSPVSQTRKAKVVVSRSGR